jgi:transcriptional regulator with XRE-family HTH domain
MPDGLRLTLAAVMPEKLRTWTDRLNWAMTDRGVKNAELARACNIERASITEWRNGKTKDPKLAPFFAACTKLKVRPRWLALGELPIDPLPDDAVQQPSMTTLLTEIARALADLNEEDQRKVLEIVLRMPQADRRPTRATAAAR